MWSFIVIFCIFTFLFSYFKEQIQVFTQIILTKQDINFEMNKIKQVSRKVLNLQLVQNNKGIWINF